MGLPCPAWVFISYHTLNHCAEHMGLKEGIIYSDIYNANIFVEMYKGKIIWSKDLGGWYIFDGKIWRRDGNDHIRKYQLEAYHEISKRMMTIGKSEAFSHMKKSASAYSLTAMSEIAKADLGISSENFDQNPFLYNCFNGTYDLEKDIFRPHDSADYMTKTGMTTFDPEAKAPLWEKFLTEIFLGEKDIIDFMQRVMGYSMTASTKEHCMFILYGHGRNGKSKFIEAISNVLGNYAISCPSSMFAIKQNQNIPNDVARLKGSRFAIASETNMNVNLDEELVKKLTGDHIITARFLNKEFFDFTPTAKIFMITNHKPNIRGTDPGIWRKIMMIPFELHIKEGEEDKDLGDKLRGEYPGILNWIINGYREYVKRGLDVPPKVRRATQLYREEEDDLGRFIKDECILGKGTISAKDFRQRFYDINGYHKSNKTVYEYMERNGHVFGDNRVMINNKQVRGYVGIRWKTEMDIVVPTGEVGWTE